MGRGKGERRTAAPEGEGTMRRTSSARVNARCLGVACLALAGAVAGCAGGAGAPPPVLPRAVLDGAAIRVGRYTPAEAEAAAELILEAERLAGAGDPAGALDLLGEVETRYATAPGSSRALWLRAQALRHLEDFEGAETAAERYVEIVAGDVAAAGRGYLLRAEIRREGQLPGGLEALFDIPADAEDAELLAMDALAAHWAGGLSTPDLRDLIVEAPQHPRVLPVFLTELAVRRYLVGEEEEARAIARQSLELSPGASASRQAADILDGTISESLEVAAIVGGILPVFGSPGVSRLARDIAEGVEVALAVEDAGPVRFVAIEDAAGPEEIASAVARLEGQNAAGMIGPLQDGEVLAAARSRTTRIPIVTPTARMIPEGVAGVYSLNGIDPNAGAALAALVLSRRVGDVVVVHTDSPEMHEEFGWFSSAYREGGGRISRVITYPPGATGFRANMREVIEVAPEGLVLILPPEDVELLAPQIAFYGVDDLVGLRIFGNQSWTSEGVLRSVQARSTEGVFSVTSRADGGGFGPGWPSFVEAYEEHFQRSLRSPTAALGYDAARLLLRAARTAGGDPEGTAEAFEEIVGYAGATGLISVTDGRIRRSFVPVRIENRAPVLLNP